MIVTLRDLHNMMYAISIAISSLLFKFLTLETSCIPGAWSTALTSSARVQPSCFNFTTNSMSGGYQTYGRECNELGYYVLAFIKRRTLSFNTARTPSRFNLASHGFRCPTSFQRLFEPPSFNVRRSILLHFDSHLKSNKHQSACAHEAQKRVSC